MATDHDTFITNEFTKMLGSDEQILHTAYMVKQPGLLVQILLVGGLLLFLLTKAYYVVLTNRRLLIMRTKQGFFKPKMENLGVEEIDISQISKVTTSGIANNRSMTFHMTDSSKKTLRIAPWLKLITGQKEFLEEVPKKFGQDQLAAG